MFFLRKKKKMSELSGRLAIKMLRSFLEKNEGLDQEQITPIICKHLKLEKLRSGENFEISAQVLERLHLRHAILKNMELVESTYDASRKYVPRVKQIVVETNSKKSAAPSSPPAEGNSGGATEPTPKPGDPKIDREASTRTAIDEFRFDVDSERSNRVYRLAATDLFVEKAISYLEKDAAGYIIKGTALFVFALVVLVSGVVFSAIFMFNEAHKSKFDSVYSATLVGYEILSLKSESWIAFAGTFTKSFTFYGFVVLLAVVCLRVGKALLDQAERLRERRHSLRQGRLYIHLSNGEVTIEELEKAFDWNVSKGNAFGNIPTEASAPWGSVIKEALKAIPEAFKKARGSMKD